MQNRVCLIAPRGGVSKHIIRLLDNDKELDIISGIVSQDSNVLDVDINTIAGLSNRSLVHATSDLDKAIQECDVIIDFSIVEVSMNVLEYAIKYQKPLVCGTTGFNPEQKEAFIKATQTIPLMFSDNTSKLVNVMQAALAFVVSKVDANVDIVEMHSNRKKDKPSGTSKDMKEILNDEAIEIHSIRSGDIASTHSVYFGLDGERLELTHHAYDMSSYAQGAIDAAKYIINKKPARYSMQEIYDLI